MADTEAELPDSILPGMAARASANLAIFAVEVGQWAGQTAGYLSIAGKTAFLSSLEVVEKTKNSLISPLLKRNSALGRPFSPLGVGGLTAVIGISGALFGHNGLIRSQTENGLVLSQVEAASTAVSGNVLANGVMVDSTKLQTVIPAGRQRDEVVTYKVQNNESLESIAKKYNVTTASIEYVNNMQDDATVKPGQDLTILPVSGVLVTVKQGDTVASIADHWKVPAQAIVDINWLDEPYEVTPGQKLVIPNAEIPTPTPTTPVRIASGKAGSSFSSTPTGATGSLNGAVLNEHFSVGSVIGSGMFMFPTTGQLTQYFTYYHNGIDIGTMTSTPPIYAAATGTVTFAGWWDGGGGNSVWIDHHNGYITQYAHMSVIGVKVGQEVARGQQIGQVGETGLAFGDHLHFMVLQNGRPINPLSVL